MACVWLTGLSGSGKTTIATLLAHELRWKFADVHHLDGDIVRATFCKDLGFSTEDRAENIRRVSYVASYLSSLHSTVVVCSFISPLASYRDEARRLIEDFKLVHVDCPLSVCENRDPKGLYAKARSGEIKNFTGIDHPYEEPVDPELTVRTDKSTVQECVDKIVSLL